MWTIAQTAKETNSRPSRLLCIEDELAAYQFDCAVVTFRIIVENALLERTEIGSGSSSKSVPRYTLEQLLQEGFILPRDGDSDLSTFTGADGGYYDEVG